VDVSNRTNKAVRNITLWERNNTRCNTTNTARSRYARAKQLATNNVANSRINLACARRTAPRLNTPTVRAPTFYQGYGMDNTQNTDLAVRNLTV
jgi:hypothetical protein